jgi:hypothetical protein
MIVTAFLAWFWEKVQREEGSTMSDPQPTIKQLYDLAIDKLNQELANGYIVTIREAVTVTHGPIQVELDIRLNADQTWEITEPTLDRASRISRVTETADQR